VIRSNELSAKQFSFKNCLVLWLFTQIALEQKMAFGQKTFRKKLPEPSGKLSTKPKNITLVSIDTRQVAKHDQAEFQPATQTDLD
jgi:hypothetical protein